MLVNTKPLKDDVSLTSKYRYYSPTAYVGTMHHYLSDSMPHQLFVRTIGKFSAPYNINAGYSFDRRQHIC